MKAYANPLYKRKNVITDSLFDYVEFHLKKNHGDNFRNALFYWNQARNFYESTKDLPIESKPLNAYYACMNAAKSFLAIKNENLENISHGVSSSRNDTIGNILTDKLTFNQRGVLFLLGKNIGYNITKKDFKIKELLYNLVCVHRTFCITNPEFTELFLPVKDLKFRKHSSRPIYYLEFSIDLKNKNYYNKYLPQNIELTPEGLYRIKHRFDWDVHTSMNERLLNLLNYHRKYRKDFHYIKSSRTLWYIKKYLPQNKEILDIPSIIIIYAVMHWLSELVRYSPEKFCKILSSKNNWLIREFVDVGLPQFMDEISSEITGSDISPFH